MVWSSGAASAQSVSVLEWNFGTATYSNVANVKHAAVSSSSVTLAPNSGTTLVASGTGNSSDRQMQAGSWNGTETTTLVAGRSSLTPVSASKVLHSTFAISHTSVANWNTMQVMVNCKRGATTDVTKVRAYLTWAEGGVWKTRYSSIATLSGTSMATVTLPLNTGATAPTVVAGNTFLLELHFWGSTSSTNSVTIDDLKFQVNSLTNTTASGTLWVSTSSGTGGRLEKYDMTALTKTIVGLTSDSGNHTFFDIAWAPNGKLYGIEPDGSVSRVYEINPNTAATTWVGTVTGSHNGMVFNASGTAYISSFGDGNIYTFSTSSLSTGSTTTATLAYDSPAQTPNGGMLTSGGDLAWVGNHLYYAATGGGRFYLYKVVSGTSAVTLVGEIKDYNNVPVSGVYGLIGDGYGSIWAQAGPYLYKLSSTTAVAEAVGIAVTSNTVYGGAISTEFRQINLDYGDYSGFGAVSNVVNSNLRIGGQVDGESDISNGNATSDDTTGVDDEDGVTVPASLPRGSSQSLTVSVTNASGAGGYLNAWIDWNRNGVLTDNGDQIATNLNVANNTTNGSVSVPFTVPMTASLGAVGVRVRLSSASSPGPTGESASNGETEDYVSTVYCPTITVTPTTLPGSNVGAAYNQVDGFSASGGNVPYSYSATGVPPGLTFNTGSRKLTGTPTAPGTYAIVVTAVDSVGCSGSVTVPFTATCPTITLGPVSPPVATVGSLWSMTLTQTGAAATPVTYAATTPLPAWVTLSSTTGVVSGTPPSSSGFSFNVKATDATGCIGSIGYTIYPACPAIAVSGALPTPVQRNASYGTRTLTASGGTSPYTWNVVNGSLPIGLVLTSGVTATTATVSGTPTTLQTSSFTIRATDAHGCTKDTSYTVVIGCGSLAVSLPSVNATVGTAYAQTATASGGTAPYTFTLNSGSLPTWATLTASTGLLAGTPTSSTAATFTLKATDANGCVGVSASYTITPGTSFDFGDWNGAGAATTMASSLVNGNLRLGATVDTEASVTPDADASVDGADEDAVTLPAMIARGQAVTMPVTVFNNNTAGRYLKSWVDFNNDGTFNDADLASGGERVYNATVPAGAALQTVNIGFTVPGSASVGTKRGVRFRVTDSAATTPVSSGAAGETEDYVVRLCPQIVICPAVTQLPVATRGSAYSVLITALGGGAPYTFSTTGTLPTGLTLHPSTGVLGGTPTTDQTATFTVKATDATGCEVTRSYTVQVVGPGSVVQVVGGSGTNNVPVRAASYRVNGTTTSQSTESSGVSSTTNSVIELLSLTVQDGAANKTLNVANLNGGSVTNVTVPATNSSFGVLLNGTATSIATSGAAGFSASAAQISSNTNLNHYIFDDRGEGEPDSTGEYDIRFSYGFTSEDYIVVQERFGNSHVQLQPLDATGNVIAGSRTVQVRGTHDWNTGYASASYQSGQSYYLTVVRQTLFGTTSPIFGFRLSINGADCKFFGMSDNPFSDNPTNAGVVGDLVWNDTDQDGVKDTGESGISGVLVKLLNAADLTTVTTTVTDGNGTYSFTAVAPGDYRIEFVRPTGYGFSPADAGGNDALDSDADISTGRTAVFTMLPCDSISYLDAGMYGVDYGDYSGFASATQTVNSAIRIGTLATDAEATNPSNSAATGDDNTGDDEDLTMPSFTVGSATTLAVPMTVTTASLNGSTACVNVFVDWNGDSDVADTNETLTAQTVSASGTFNFSLTPPAGTYPGTKYLRIRAVEGSTHSGFSGTSTLKGEVEDYSITVREWIEISPPTLPPATAGLPYAQALSGTGGLGAYGWSLSSGALPPGLSLAPGSTNWLGSGTAYANVFSPASSATVDPPNGGLLSVQLGGSAGPVQSGIWSLRATGGASISLLGLGLLETGAKTAVDGSALKFQMGNNSSSLLGALGVGTAISSSWEATATLNQSGAQMMLQPGTRYMVSFDVDGSNGLLQSGLGISPSFSVELLDGGGTALASSSSGTLINLLGLLGTGVTSGRVTLQFDTPATMTVGPASLRFKGGAILNTTVLGLGTTFATVSNLQVQTVSPGYSSQAVISGVPNCAPGTYNFTVRAADGMGNEGTRVYALTLNAAMLSISPSTLTSGMVGQVYSQATGFTASGGLDPYTFTASGLPPGLTYDSGAKKIIGTPSMPGSYTVTITASFANACPSSTDIPLTIQPPANLSLGNLVWEDFNNDGIKQVGESGLPNANVRLYRSGADNTVNTADDTLLAGPVPTPASGAYSFTGLGAGNYYVRVSPPASNFRTGGTPDTADNNEDNDNNGSQPGGVGTSCYSPIINLAVGAETTAEDADANTNMTVDFGLWGGFTVGNVVWHDANNDGIKGSGEALLPAVTLQLMTPGADLVAGGTDDTVLLTTTTDATGVYNFFVPQTGKFYVRLNPIPGYELPSGVVFGDTGADNDNNGTQPGGIGSFVNSMVFDLQAATEPGSTGTTNVETTIDFGLWSGLSVSGYVWNDANNNGLTDPAGAPGTAPELGIESQALILYSTGADHAVGGSGGNADALVATTTSLAGGSYAFSRLLPGYYYLRITPGSAYPLASAVVDIADNGELNDNNGAQPGGISTDITSPVFQLSALTEPGTTGSTSIENSLWFGLRERPTIVISPPTLAGGQVGLPYTQTVSASGGTAPYAWSVSSGSLPEGLTLNPATGEISGTPSVAGTAFFTVQARDAQRVTGTRSYSLTIYQIEISPPVLPVAYRDQSFSQGLTATGGTEPYRWSVLSGSLPPGVTLNPSSGLLSGTPTATGTYAFTVKVMDVNDFYGTRAYTLTVLGTLGLGNLVFEDLDGNGFYDPGEGIDGVRVELYRSDQVAGVDEPLDFLVTANGGKYVFSDIPPGVYVVHIPAVQFGSSGLLRGLFSLPDVQEGDDDAGEDGVDSAAPQTTGITSTPVTLAMDSLPTDAEGETGFDHESDNSSEAGDAGVDLTLDLGFYRRVSVGNLVFVDGNGNGVANNGEGVANVTVQVYRVVTVGQDEQLVFVKQTVTEPGGRYLLTDLQPGLYRVHIPKEMFLPGAALEAKVSIAPGQFGDDDVGEDGLNDTDPVAEGVWTNGVYLQASLAPTNNNGETGTDYTTDDDIDAAVDLTVDFGFQSPAIIGNLVFVDTNNNGHYDPGEGVDGVVLDIYVSGAAVGSLPAATVTTADGGHYLFGNLSGGTYFINVRASNFTGENSPLAGKVSLLGASAAGSDDSVGEDGLDNPSPQNGGISSAEFLVQAGSLPLDSAVGAAMGENGFQADDDNGNSQDANGDMTIDFGFKPVDNTKMAVGNLAFNDLDGDGIYDDGEGVDGVLMELHRASDDLLLASTFTGNGGLYTFSNLDPGDYYLVVAASNFQGTGKLAGKVPMAGQGGDVGIDDDADENGDDPVDPSVTGVRSVDFTLAAGTEPTDFDTELGAATYLDALIDANSDLTFDFGFYPVGGIGNLVFADLNKNGKADTGEGIGGVTVRLFAAGADPLNPETRVVAETITDSTAGHEGFYLFTNLPPGDYFAHIPAAMFESGAPLSGKTSMTGVESGLKDDHQGENGLDSSAAMEQGVSTAITQLRPGSEPFGTQEAGLYGGEDNGLGDKLYDMTLDFGFVRSPAVGNLVFEDVNRDGVFTEGLDQGIDGVTVELYTTDANPVLKASTVTANGGRYLLSAPAGSYTIQIPAAMFEVSAPLYNQQGTLAGVPGDDDVGQDAIDSADRLVQGVRTAAFTLAEGTMPTAANGETGHDKDSDTASDADTNLTIDLGFHPLPLGIGNLVFNDVNGNGLFDTGDTGIAGVAVKLFLFGDDPLTAPAVASAETDTGGFYRLNAYVQDNYFVHIAKENFAVGGPLAGLVSTPGASLDSDDDDANENGVDAASPESSGISSGLISLIYGAQPEDAFTESGIEADADNEADANADLTVDFGFRVPSGAPLAGMVRRDLNNDGVATAADAPLQTVEVALYEDGNANGQLDTAEMSAVAATTSDIAGAYVFSDVVAGNYLVVASPLPGATAQSDTDGGLPDQTQVTVSAAPVTDVDFLQSLAPDTFAGWQREHPLDGSNRAGDNPDNDGSSNLLEYALGTDPASGVVKLPGFELLATERIEAVLRRPAAGQADLRFLIQGSLDGAAWSNLDLTPAASTEDGIETRRYPAVADAALFAGRNTGYVRLRVELDADQNSAPEAVAFTPVQAFSLQSLPLGQTTLSMPLLKPEVFIGGAVVGGGRTLLLDRSEGLLPVMKSGSAYEVQWLDGAAVGHCFEIDVPASTSGSLVLKTDLPAGLGGGRVAVRPVSTLREVVPPALLQAGSTASVADRVLFFENGAYRVHWLASAKDGSRWVADATLADSGGRRLPHQEGFLVHLRHAPVVIPLAGQVPVSAPVLTVAPGTRLVGSGGLSALNPKGVAGDRLRGWSGDSTPGTSSFINHTCGATGWISDATGQPSGTPPLLNPFRAVFTVKGP